MKLQRFRTLAAIPIAAIAAALSFTAFAQERVISSDDANALIPPRAWDCSKIYPEYSAWLEAGNTPDTWRYAGPTYRDVADGTRYDWNDWLAWYDRACPAAAPVDSGLPDNAELIGGVVGALAVTGIIAGSGGGSSNGGGGDTDSPG